MTGKSPRLAGLNPAPNNGFKKRVFKACERCKLKKVKCEGVSPCQRCKADDVICLFKKNNSRRNKDVPTGYVEFLETRYQLLAQGLRESHARLVSANLLPSLDTTSIPRSSSEDPDLAVSIQTILGQLGIQASNQACYDNNIDSRHVPDPVAEFSQLAPARVPSSSSLDSPSETRSSPSSSPADEPWPVFDTSELRFIKDPMPFYMPSPELIDNSEYWGFADAAMATGMDVPAQSKLAADEQLPMFDVQDPNFASFMSWDWEGMPK